MSSAEEKTKNEQAYYMKGIPIHAYLSENGEFRWIPAAVACSNKENTKDILEVLKKMPEDRRLFGVQGWTETRPRQAAPYSETTPTSAKSSTSSAQPTTTPTRKNQEKTKGVTQ